MKPRAEHQVAFAAKPGPLGRENAQHISRQMARANAYRDQAPALPPVIAQGLLHRAEEIESSLRHFIERTVPMQMGLAIGDTAIVDTVARGPAGGLLASTMRAMAANSDPHAGRASAATEVTPLATSTLVHNAALALAREELGWGSDPAVTFRQVGQRTSELRAQITAGLTGSVLAQSQRAATPPVDYSPEIAAESARLYHESLPPPAQPTVYQRPATFWERVLCPNQVSPNGTIVASIRYEPAYPRVTYDLWD